MTPKEAVQSLILKAKDDKVIEFKKELKALKDLLDYNNYNELDLKSKDLVIKNIYYYYHKIYITFKCNTDYTQSISFLEQHLDIKAFNDYKLKCAEANLVQAEREINDHEYRLIKMKQRRSKFKREIKKLEKLNESSSST